MARPTEFNTITVIQDYVNFLGTISTGTVTFEPPNTFFKAQTSDVAITPKAIVGTLNTQGRLEVVLPFTDDPDIIPHFTYHVTENIDGLKRSTDIQIPIDLAAQGNPVKLYDLTILGSPVLEGDNLLTKTAADLLYVKLGDPGAGLESWAQMEALFEDMPTVFPPEIGPLATQAVAGNDARLTNTRTPTDGSVTTAKIVDGAVTSAKIADATIVNADVSGTAAIALDKTADSTGGSGRLAMTNAERTKLGTVATGATANQNDTYLLSRSNHTGSQAPETIANLIEYIEDAVGQMFSGGNVTAVYNDTTGDISLTAPANTGADPESVQDALQTALIGVGAITVTYNDSANTFTFSTTATQNSSDAFLLSRANHTGSQATSTITGLDTSLAALAPKASPTFTGTTTVANLTATGTVTLPDNSLAIADISGLQTALNSKPTIVGEAFRFWTPAETLPAAGQGQQHRDVFFLKGTA